MCKAILVMDMPSKCNGCPILMAGFYCRAMNGKTAVTSYLNTTKPKWCPLREVPQKKEISNAKTMTDLGWIEGYNACIDEISKEKK